MKKKVLILGVSAVQTDAICILKEMGLTTHACSGADDGPGSKQADHYAVLDFKNTEELIEYIKDNNIDCVYSVGSDLATKIYTKVNELLHFPSFVPSETAYICNNKNVMRKFLGPDFKGNVGFQVLENETDKISLDYPFIMKPTDSQGQRGVRLIHNDAEFQETYPISKNYSKSGLVIIEDYINGPELSVNAYMVNGEIALLLTSDRVCWPNFQGGLIHKHVLPSKILNLELTEALEDLVGRFSKKLQIDNGPLYMQIKTQDNQPYIIEATPRLDGCHMWKLIKYYTGIDLIKLTFSHLLFNDISELQNFRQSDFRYTLEFLCEYPNKRANYSKFLMPESIYDSCQYYSDNDLIRPINNQFEKIGYFITRELTTTSAPNRPATKYGN